MTTGINRVGSTKGRRLLHGTKPPRTKSLMEVRKLVSSYPAKLDLAGGSTHAPQCTPPTPVPCCFALTIEAVSLIGSVPCRSTRKSPCFRHISALQRGFRVFGHRSSTTGAQGTLYVSRVFWSDGFLMVICLLVV